MARPVPILIAIAGFAMTGLGGIALGQYAASGVDPTKAAAYRQAGYARLAASVSDDRWPGVDAASEPIPAGYASTGTGFPAPTARY